MAQYLTDADNKRFNEVIADYIKRHNAAEAAGKALPKIPEFVGWYFLTLAQHIGSGSSYNGYSYLDAMISDGIDDCLRYCRKYDPLKSKTGSPFSYFTIFILRAFWRRIEIEKEQQYVKCKVAVETNLINEIHNEINDLPDDLRGEFMSNSGSYDNIYEFIGEFEKKRDEKKAKARAKKKNVDKSR